MMYIVLFDYERHDEHDERVPENSGQKRRVVSFSFLLRQKTERYEDRLSHLQHTYTLSLSVCLCLSSLLTTQLHSSSQYV